MLRRLTAQVSLYSASSALATLAGLISFPLLTRMFSTADYGLISLVSASLTLLVALAKSGMQHSVVRFAGDCHGADGATRLQQLRATSFWGMACVGAALALLWLLVLTLLPTRFWDRPEVVVLMMATSVLVLVRAVNSGMMNLLRAQQLVRAYSAINVLQRYLIVAAVFGVLILVSATLTAYYLAVICAELAGLALLLYWSWKVGRYPLGAASLPLFRQMFVFGLPLFGMEISGGLHDVSDRYIIHGLLGAAPLGTYSAAYNLAEYVEAVCLAPIGLAIAPMYLRIWSSDGRAATERFLGEVLHYFVLAALAVSVGLLLTGRELIVLLASERYSDGGIVVSMVIFGKCLMAAFPIVGAGLYIQRRTGAMMRAMLLAAVSNIALNLLLVPRFGIAGAAGATIVSAAILVTGTYLMGRSAITPALPWRALLIGGLAAAAMSAALRFLPAEPNLLRLLGRALLGAAVYAGVVLALDARCRAACRLLFSRWSRGRAQALP